MVDEDYDTLVTRENLKLINKLFCSPLSLKKTYKIAKKKNLPVYLLLPMS